MPARVGILRVFVHAAFALASTALFAADLVVEKSYASAADFEPFFRDGSIDLQSSPGAITLRRTALPSSTATNIFPKNGTIVSPVIDTAATGTVDSIAPLFKIRSLAVQWRSIVSGSGSVTLEARSGNSPWPDETWTTPWSAAERVLPARYIQVRATIHAEAGDDVAPGTRR